MPSRMARIRSYSREAIVMGMSGMVSSRAFGAHPSASPNSFHSMDRRVNPRIKSGGGDDGYLPLSRSAGGAISATRSRTNALFDSGFTIISRGSSRVVPAYAGAPSISNTESLQALAFIQENRVANVA